MQGAHEHQQEGNASLPFLDAGEHMESLGLLSAAQIRLCHPRGFIVLSAESVVVNSLTCGGSRRCPKNSRISLQNTASLTILGVHLNMYPTGFELRVFSLLPFYYSKQCYSENLQSTRFSVEQSQYSLYIIHKN